MKVIISNALPHLNHVMERQILGQRDLICISISNALKLGVRPRRSRSWTVCYVHRGLYRIMCLWQYIEIIIKQR